MDMDHAKLGVEVLRVNGTRGEAFVTVDGPGDLLLHGLATLIWKTGQEIGWDPVDLCDTMKRVLQKDELKMAEED